MIAERDLAIFATASQKRKIAQLCMALGFRERLEDTVITSQEASDLIKELCSCIKVNRGEGRLYNRFRLIHIHSMMVQY